MPATINIRDKIALLESQIQQEEQQRFAQELIVADAAESTGDAEIDKAMKIQAESARTTMRACEHRLKNRHARLADYQEELKQSVKSDPATSA